MRRYLVRNFRNAKLRDILLTAEYHADITRRKDKTLLITINAHEYAEDMRKMIIDQSAVGSPKFNRDDVETYYTIRSAMMGRITC